MKKIAGFAVAIIAVVLFTYSYRLQTVAWFDRPVMAVADGQLTKNLKNGLGKGGDGKVLELKSSGPDQPLYRRGNQYYLGAEKEKVDFSFPFYTNDGTSLYYLSDKSKLITADFAALESFEGLHLTNGRAFYFDGTQADEEEYLMTAAGNGLYMNLQPMTITSSTRKTEIRLNSILHLESGKVRFYSYEEGLLVYHEDTVMYGAVVTIGSVTMDYEGFLKLLEEARTGKKADDAGKDLPDSQKGGQNDGENEAEKQNGRNNSGKDKSESTSSKAGNAEGDSGDSLSGGASAANVAGQKPEEVGNSGEEDINSSEGQTDLGLAGSGKDGGGSGSTAGSSSSDSSGGGAASSGQEEQGGASQNENSGNGGSNAPGSDTEGDLSGAGDGSGGTAGVRPEQPYMEPVIALSDVSMGVYTMNGVLSVEDPEGRLVRAILRFYKDGVPKSRKNMRGSGSFEVKNLEPDTEYEVIGTMVFKNQDGTRVTQNFMENIQVRTRPLTDLKQLFLSFDDSGEYLPTQLIIKNMRLSSTEEGGEEEVLPYVSKVVVEARKQGILLPDTIETFLGSTQVRKLRQEIAVDWTSDELFDSDSSYIYTVTVQDRFRNALILTVDSRTGGVGRTCKRAPFAVLTESGNQVGRQLISARVGNPNNAVIDNCLLKILNTSGEPVPAFADMGDNINTAYQRAISADGSVTEIEITMLPAGEYFQIVVTGDYDLHDRDVPNQRTGVEMGKLSIYTAPISRLGYAYLDIKTYSVTSSSFTAEIKLNREKTSEGLLALMGRMPLIIMDKNQQVLYDSSNLMSKASLEQIAIPAPAPDPVTSLTIQSQNAQRPAVEIRKSDLSTYVNAWEAYLAGAEVIFRFPQGYYASKTEYTLAVQAIAAQGGKEYAVHAPTNKSVVQTLRKAPVFVNEAEFTISNFYELYGFKIDDPDGAVAGGTVVLRLYSEGSLVTSRTLNTNQVYDKLRFDNLKQNTEYIIQFVTATYNEGYTAETKIENYVFDLYYQFRTGQGITGSIQMQRVVAGAGNTWDASVNARINDQMDELLGQNYKLKIYGAAGIDTEDRDLVLLEEQEYPFVNPLNAVHVYNSRPFWKYRVELVIHVMGYEIMLDSASYTTESEMDTISSWAEMVTKLQAKPNGKFAVIEDFDKTSNTTLNFYGSIDFQGHRIGVGPAYPTQMFSTLQESAVVENVVIDYRQNLTATSSYRGSVVEMNYGTIRNIVVNADIRGKYASVDLGLVTRRNYRSGIVENFVLNLVSDWYLHHAAGGITYSNEGLIRKGYIYGRGITVGSAIYGGYSAGRENVGGIVGVNQPTGRIEDVFSLIDISFEQGTNQDYLGGVAGQNTGVIENSFSVGDIYTYSYNTNGQQTALTPYNGGGGVIGIQGSAGRSAGNYYFSMTDVPTTYNRVYATAEDVQRLWDQVWYENTFSYDSGWQIGSQVKDGYYPKLVLPDSMSMEQKNLALPPAPAVNAPEYVSNTVETLSADQAELTLNFKNPNMQRITEINIEHLTTEILSQDLVDGVYKVVVRVTNPTAFRSQYLIQSVGYKRHAAASTSSYVIYGPAKPRYAEVSFYKQIRTVADWDQISYSLSDNYMLAADLDFSQASSQQMMVDATFTGKLDGAGHTVRNISLASSYVIKTVSGGLIKDITFENVSLGVLDNDTAKSRALNGGIIYNATNKSDLTGVIVKNITMTGVPATAGALAGTVTYTNVKDCRAEGVNITTAFYRNTPLSIGGLIGKSESGVLENIYVSGLNLTAAKGFSSQGIGGLVGTVTGSGSLMNAYAQGDIKTVFSMTGGLIGSSTTSLSNVWTYVNIGSNTIGAGGILGNAAASISINRSLVLGDIVSDTQESVGRIYGTTQTGGTTVTMYNTAAYARQLVGNGISSSLMDANWLVTAADLNDIGVYRDNIRLGKGFDLNGESGYSLSGGYMPMLRSINGELLTPQKPVLRRDERLEILGANLDENQGTDTYTLQIQVKVEDSGYVIDRAECDGLTLNGKELVSHQGGPIIRYTDVSPSKYLGSYQIKVYLKRGEEEQVLTVKVNKTLSRVIWNETQWVEYMRDYGESYENFRIAADLDLTSYTSPVNLKIGSLVGMGATKTIKGITYAPASDGEALFATVNGEVSNLVFENITINNETKGKAGNYVGVIGRNQGTVKDVTFKNIVIKGNKAGYIGCIGINTGVVKNIQAENLSVTSVTNVSSSSYVGGVIGYNQGEASNITARGSGSSSGFTNRPERGDYSYLVEGYQFVGGVIGYTTAPISDVSIQGAWISAGSNNVGGISGTQPVGESKNLTAGDPANLVIPLAVTGKDRVGGVFGDFLQDSSKWGILSDSGSYHLYVTGTSNVGGLIAGGDWYCRSQDNKVIGCEVRSTGNNTGGVFGATGETIRCLVQDTTVLGTSNVGGLVGTVGSTPYGNVVDASEVRGSAQNIGGMVGYTYGNGIPNRSIVNNSRIVGEGTAVNVGGLVGFFRNGSTISDISIQNTEVSGFSRVGGVTGLSKGGRYTRINSNATVIANDCAGALAGELYEFDMDPISYNSAFNPTVTYAILAGSVRAQSGMASAFAGRLTYDSPKRDLEGNIVGYGRDYLDAARFHHIVLAASVASGDPSTASRWAYFSLDGIANMEPEFIKPSKRIDTITIVSNSTAKPYSTLWDGMRITDLSGSDAGLANPLTVGYMAYGTATSAQKQLMTVATSANLAVQSFYWSQNANTVYNYSALTASPAYFPYLWGNVTGGYAMIQGKLQDYQNGTYATGIPIPQAPAMAMAMMAAYMVETPSQALSFQMGGDPMEGGNLLKELAKKGSLVSVYASGAASINAELAKGVSGIAGLTLELSFGEEEALVQEAGQRVYTLSYDFTKPVKATLRLDGYTKTYEFGPRELAKTVMNWQDNYYYLAPSGVRGRESLLEGSYVNLYQGIALDAAGDLWDVSRGEHIGSVEASSPELLDTAPLYTFNYGGRKLEVYQGFTRSSGSGLSMELDSLAFVKDGKLYAVDGDTKIKTGSVIADRYSSKQYLTVLGTDGVLHHMENAIALPEGFDNSKISEWADNFFTDKTFAIGRYKDGRAFAFNYLTGTEELLEESQYFTGEKLGLLEFAQDFISEKFGSWMGFSNGTYQASAQLREQLENGVFGDLDQILNGEGNLETAGAETGAQTGAEPAPLSITQEETLNGQDGVEAEDLSVGELLSDGELEENGNSEDGMEGSLAEDVAEEAPAAGRAGSRVVGMEGGTGADEPGEPLDDAQNSTVGPEGTDGQARQGSGSAGDAGAGTAGAGSQGTGTTGAGSQETGMAGTGSQGTGTTGSGSQTAGAGTAGSGNQGTGTAGSGTGAQPGAAGTTPDAQSQSGALEESAAGSAAAFASQPAATQKLISVYDAAAKEYKIYNVDEFLSNPKTQLVSVNEKVKEMSKMGMISRGSDLEAAGFVDEHKNGIRIFAGTSLIILLLCLYLISRRYRK